MDIRYSANQRDVKRYTTEELRKEFLIQNLYQADEVVAVYSHVDRMVTMDVCRFLRRFLLKKALTVGRTLEPTIFWNAVRSVFSILAEKLAVLLLYPFGGGLGMGTLFPQYYSMWRLWGRYIWK